MQPHDATVRKGNFPSTILSLHQGFQPLLFISAALFSLFISEEVIRWTAERDGKTEIKPHEEEEEERVEEETEEKSQNDFLSILFFGIFLGPLSLAVLSPQRLWVLNGCFLTQSEQMG